MAQSKVPKFGAWDSEENVGYTVRFETVRKGNNPGGPLVNPNDIQANQVATSAAPHQTKPKQKQPEFGAWEEGEEEVAYTQYFEDRGKFKASPSGPQMNYNVGPTQPVKAADGPNGGRATRPTTQGVKFVDAKQSPLHRGAAGRGGQGTTTLDNNRGAHVAPRQRPHATAGPSPNRGGGGGGASVPVFGDWNKNPAQADGYTVVFNKLQEDKRNGNVPSVDSTPTRPHYSPQRKPSKQGGCFSWIFG